MTLKRSEFKRQPAKEPKPKPGPRKIRCKVCREQFAPNPPWLRHCSPNCGAVLAVQLLAKQKAKTQKAERAETKAKLAKFKTKADWLRETQAIFNQCMRWRDRLAGYSCISSGRPLDWTGNAVDAGHYRSVGSAPHLRFNEDNVHAQSKHDNQYKSGNAVDYRIGLIARIGLARVEALESDNEPRHYTISDLQAIKASYTAKLRELKGK